ncbi:MAG TPA: response regulator, partial [Noviherbaspirillum sp.]
MPESEHPLHQRVNILLVDDEPANLLALEAILGQLGETLVRANSGEEALRKTAGADFAVILLDVRMPGMSGFETARRIRGNSRFSNTPILFLTAAPDDPTFPVEKAYEFGAVDYLIKPLIPAVLRAKVAFFVELYRKTEDLARIERERLRESRAQFALLLESCGEGIYGVDLDGICTFINAAGAEMFGYRPKELIGRSLHELIHDRQPDGSPTPPFRCRICRAARAGIRVRSGDEVFWRKDGMQVPVSCSVAPMIIDGRNIGTVVACIDITARKRTENALRKAAADLSEANQRKTEFLATLAHELRNPLAPMLSGLEVMRLAKDDRETVGKVRDMLQRQLGNMVHLVNDLLDVARIGGGKVELRKAKIEVRHVVESAVETSRPLIEAGSHVLTLSLPEEPLVVDADPTRIAQVL